MSFSFRKLFYCFCENYRENLHSWKWVSIISNAFVSANIIIIADFLHLNACDNSCNNWMYERYSLHCVRSKWKHATLVLVFTNVRIDTNLNWRNTRKLLQQLFFLFLNYNRTRISGSQSAIWYRFLVISELPFFLYSKIDLVDYLYQWNCILEDILYFWKTFY